ncbi:perlucin-like protein isoform X2 [Rana temporaria]|nr:perlucin-like protein isoform X2 [Rana temporaria]XP_040203046.1 perlucin-like protein isoform X2 [Rana temporaria]
MFLILFIFTSLLFVFYTSITEEQSRLNNHVKELNSQLENNEQETNNNFTIEISHLRSNVKELTSQLKNYKEETDSGLKRNVSALKESVGNITDGLKKIKNENIQEASCTSCPNGWQLIKSNCYYFQDEGVSWDRSQEECEKRNGVIVILKDKAELDSLLPTIGYQRYWLGLRRDNKDINNWLWADGSRLTFSAWNTGEPNNEHNSEHCAEILGGPKSMNDRNCEANIGYICKRAWTC